MTAKRKLVRGSVSSYSRSLGEVSSDPVDAEPSVLGWQLEQRVPLALQLPGGAISDMLDWRPSANADVDDLWRAGVRETRTGWVIWETGRSQAPGRFFRSRRPAAVSVSWWDSDTSGSEQRKDVTDTTREGLAGRIVDTAGIGDPFDVDTGLRELMRRARGADLHMLSVLALAPGTAPHDPQAAGQLVGDAVLQAVLDYRPGSGLAVQ